MTDCCHAIARLLLFHAIKKRKLEKREEHQNGPTRKTTTIVKEQYQSTTKVAATHGPPNWLPTCHHPKLSPHPER